jgi:hypothetical protein
LNKRHYGIDNVVFLVLCDRTGNLVAATLGADDFLGNRSCLNNTTNYIFNPLPKTGLKQRNDVSADQFLIRYLIYTPRFGNFAGISKYPGI